MAIVARALRFARAFDRQEILQTSERIPSRYDRRKAPIQILVWIWQEQNAVDKPSKSPHVRPGKRRGPHQFIEDNVE